MPAWSPEIANVFIKLAADDRRAFNQMVLQRLVYIAHGWSLAISGEPLTGDRPEAWKFGPVYRRMLDALSRFGLEQVVREITKGEVYPGIYWDDPYSPAIPDLSTDEFRGIEEIYATFRDFSVAELSSVTRSNYAPWERIFAGGAGAFRDIPHRAIADQFTRLLASTTEQSQERGQAESLNCATAALADG